MGGLIERMVPVVRPYALLYIVLEGMAPQAKMNQ